MIRDKICVLADAVEAETAVDGQVALELGWRCEEHSRQAKLTGAWVTLYAWHSPDNEVFNHPPEFMTSLDALAAECERRGWEWYRELMPESPAYVVRAGAKAWGVAAYEQGKPSAAALCAALLRAVAAEKETTDE